MTDKWLRAVSRREKWDKFLMHTPTKTAEGYPDISFRLLFPAWLHYPSLLFIEIPPIYKWIVSCPWSSRGISKTSLSFMPYNLFKQPILSRRHLVFKAVFLAFFIYWQLLFLKWCKDSSIRSLLNLLLRSDSPLQVNLYLLALLFLESLFLLKCRHGFQVRQLPGKRNLGLLPNT